MKTRPVALYDPDQLAMLSRVLREALSETLDLVGSGESEPDVEELTSRLGKVIMDQFIAGETDPEFLKLIAIKSMTHTA